MISLLLSTVAAIFKSRPALILENLALRHKIGILQRPGKRPRLKPVDRGLWVLLSRVWDEWKESLILVKPETVIGWHKKGFRLYWKRKGRKQGRPRLTREVIGSIRHECLDHMIILGGKHLRKVLREYFQYYHESRTHLGLDKDCPVHREIEPPELGKIVAIPQVGGLHHRYTRKAA